MTTRIRLKIHGILFAALFCGTASASINIPLTITEALPAKAVGVDRISDPVTIGVPLAENSGIKSALQLTLSGADKAQFKVLGTWANGNIRWVVIDTLATVRANQTNHSVTLRDGGNGNFGGADLATEHPEFISIDTGSAQFRIKKRNFNLFDRVTVNGQTLVSAGNAGSLLLRDSSDTAYTSSNDSMSAAVIEENGPVKVVIKATGRFRDVSGNSFMGYAVRFYFYYGKSYAKTIITLKNTYQDSPSARLFKSFEAIVPASLEPDKTIDFSTNKGIMSRNLVHSAHMYQSYSNFKPAAGAIDCSHWEPPYPGTCQNPSGRFTPSDAYKGLEIHSDKEVINSLGDPDKWSGGWMELRDNSRKGVSVVYRWMGAYWPASFEATSTGTITAGLYSSFNKTVAGMKFPFFTQDQRELYWNFHTASVDNVTFSTIGHFPLIGKANWEQYVTTGCMWGQTEYVTLEQQTSFFSAFNESFDVEKIPPPFGMIFRNYSWGAAGGGNQGDYAFWGAMFEWLRSGIAEFYLKAENIINFQINAGVLRTDWDYATNNVAPIDEYRDVKPVVKIALANQPATPEMEHHQIFSLPMYYYLTGYEEAKDAMLDDAEVNIRNNMSNIWPCGKTDQFFDGNYIRAWSRKFRNMALQWEFSIQMGNENKVLKQYLMNATAGLIDAVANDPTEGTKGRSRTRGYYVGDSNRASHIHSFFYTQIMFEAVYQAYRIFKLYDPSYIRIGDLEECLGGMAQFFFKDYFYEQASGGRYWDYNYFLDRPWSPSEGNMTRYPADRAALYGYIYDGGDMDYLTKGYKAYIAYQNHALGSSNPYWSEAQAQALMYANKVAPPSKVWKSIQPIIKNDGNNQYSLSWKVPPGVEKYRIKFSEKPIVNTLGFNKYDQTWKFGPDQYTPRYYATLLDGTIEPQAEGTTQSIKINIQQAINAFNSNRGRIPDQIGHVRYNPEVNYYFDIRYYGDPSHR